MKQDSNNNKQWSAEEGKMLLRTVDNQLFGTTVVLGNIVIDGVEQEDVIGNYVEVDAPSDGNNLSEQQLNELNEIING